MREGEEALRARFPVAGRLGSDFTPASHSSSGPEAAHEDAKLLEQRGMDSVRLLAQSRGHRSLARCAEARWPHLFPTSQWPPQPWARTQLPGFRRSEHAVAGLVGQTSPPNLYQDARVSGRAKVPGALGAATAFCRKAFKVPALRVYFLIDPLCFILILMAAPSSSLNIGVEGLMGHLQPLLPHDALSDRHARHVLRSRLTAS